MSDTQRTPAPIRYLPGARVDPAAEVSREPAAPAATRDHSGWYVPPGFTDAPDAGRAPLAPDAALADVVTAAEVSETADVVGVADLAAPPGKAEGAVQRAAQGAVQGAAAVAKPALRFAAVTSISGETFDDDAVLDSYAIEQLSMRALNRRAYARKELYNYLCDHDVPSLLAEQECDRLASVNLINDAELAEVLLERLQRRKGLGAAGLKQELKRQLLDPDAIETAMASLDRDDELHRAIAQAERRRSSLASLDREAARRRLSGFLQRRGFDSQTVSKAVQAVLGQH